MLRLQPSELTLTPDDVDDTFRRIAHRQALRAQEPHSPRKAARPGRPLLRRGPRTSIQDALTTQRNSRIPPLQPQQAVHASIEDDFDDCPSSSKTPLTTRRDSFACTRPLLEADKSTPTMSTFDLPFRSGPHGHIPVTDTNLTQRTQQVPVSPPMNASHRVITPLTGAPTTTDSAGPSPQGNSAAPQSSAELRGGGKSGKQRSNSVGNHASQSSSSHVMAGSQESTNGSKPTKFLRGYFKDPSESPIGVDYSFDEYDLPIPRTEPRRSGNRHPLLMRSLSSGSAPAFVPPTQYEGTSPSPTAADPSQVPRAQPQVGISHSSSTAFNPQNYPSSPPVVNTDSVQANQAYGRPRHFSSEDSTASAAFSYYGSVLLGSRHSSSDRSSGHELARLQFDGAAPSRHLSRSTRNFESSSNISMNYPFRPAYSRSSSYSSPNLAATGQGGFSPLPSVPYTRVQSVQTLVQPSRGFTNRVSTSDTYVDASTAAARDLSSPLDDYSEEYQRLLRSQRMRQTVLSQPSSFHDHPNDIDMSSLRLDSERGRHDNPYHPQGQTPATRRLQHTLLRPAQPSEYRRNLPSYSLQSASGGLSSARAFQRSSENSPFTSSSNDDRTVQNNGQVQVQRAAYELLHAAQTRQTELAGPSNPQRYLPRDISNRPRGHASYPNAHRTQRRSPTTDTLGSPQFPTTEARHTATGSEPFTQPVPSRSSPFIMPNMPTHHRRQHRSSREHLHTTQTQPQPYNPTNNPLPTLHLPQTRTSATTTTALTSLALDHIHGTTSRRRSRSPGSHPQTTTTTSSSRPPALAVSSSSRLTVAATSSLATTSTRPATTAVSSTTARTHRRVPMHQQNQENSTDVEISAMRREEGAISARYGAGGDNDGVREEREGMVMDETPPRVGRVERRGLGE